MGSRKHKVRTQSFASKMASYPFDLLLWINETTNSIEWDDYCETFAIPLGYILTAVFIVISKMQIALTSSHQRADNPLFNMDYSTYQTIRSKAINPDIKININARSGESVFLPILNFAAISFILLSVGISYYTLRSFKTYTLLYSSVDSTPPTPSARKHSLNGKSSFRWVEILLRFLFDDSKPVDQGDSDSDSDSELDGNDNTGASFYDDSENQIDLMEKDVWEIVSWNPSKFSLYLLSSFSPLALLNVKLLIGDVATWKLLLVTFSTNSFWHFVITRKFLVLLKDKQLIYQEMFSEYNKKFVVPRTSVLKKDVEIDATHGVDAPSFFTIKTESKGRLHTAGSKVFITHDINGDPHNTFTEDENINEEHDSTLPSIKDYASPYRNHFPSGDISRPSSRRINRSSIANDSLFGQRFNYNGRDQELSERNNPRTPYRKFSSLAESKKKFNENTTPLYGKRGPPDISPFRQSTPYRDPSTNIYRSPHARQDISSSTILHRGTSPTRPGPTGLGMSPSLRTRSQFSMRSPSPKRTPSPTKSRPQWH